MKNFRPPSPPSRLQGNPACTSNALSPYCGPHDDDFSNIINATNNNGCPPLACPEYYEYPPPTPTARCLCMAPLLVGYRLKSPGFSDFLPYVDTFKEYLSSGLHLNSSNLEVATAQWQDGPRVKMDLKIFPSNTSTRLFNRSEVVWIREMFSGWGIPDSQVFGPYEFLSFTLTPPYAEGTLQMQDSLKQEAIYEQTRFHFKMYLQIL